MRIVGTVQARMGSSRLPGKVLMPILGRPMLELQVERVKQSRLIDEIVIATSVERGDDPIEQWASRFGVACFRGSEEDLLSRVVGALKASQADIHVEFMGDNPIPDPMLIDSFIGYSLRYRERYDYVTNTLKTTYPPGAEVSVYPAAVLFDAEARASDPILREHVGLSISRYPERYRICNLEAPASLRYPDLYLEVDTSEDLEVVSAVFEHFYPRNPGFSLAQAIDFLLSHPELAERNRQVARRWRAFRQDAIR